MSAMQLASSAKWEGNNAFNNDAINNSVINSEEGSLVPHPKPHVPDEVWEWDPIYSVKKTFRD